MKRHLPFLWITTFFIAGIFIHGNGCFSLENMAIGSVLILTAAFISRRHKTLFVLLILFEFILLGWLCTQSRWLFAEDHIYFQRNKTDFSQMMLRGVVDGDVRPSPMGSTRRLSFVFNLCEGKINGQWEKISGKVLVNLFQDLPLQYGDEIILTGKLHKLFEFSHNKKFSYREYLKRQGIHYVLSVKKDSQVKVLRAGQGDVFLTQLYQWRSVASRLLAQQLNPSESSLMQAMILGERLNISASIKDVFAKTGTTHILAISGLNVGIVVMVLFLLLRMIPGPRVMTYTLTMTCVVLYVLLTGASPSVVRAGIMSVVFLTSFVIERETDSINSLSFAAFLILLLDPQNIFDIGFQLSFMSVLAILIFYPLFMNLLKSFLKRYPNKILKFFAESFAVSLAATLGVAGLIGYYFNIVTPVSLLANLLVVPLSTLATILGIGLLLTAGFVPFFAICIQLVLNLMVWFMNICQNFPVAYHYFQEVNALSVLSYYFLVIAFWLWLEEYKSSTTIDKAGQV